MNTYMWLGVGVCVYLLAKAYNDMYSAQPDVSAKDAKMRRQLDAIVLLSESCVTDEAKAALDQITSCVLHHSNEAKS